MHYHYKLSARPPRILLKINHELEPGLLVHFVPRLCNNLDQWIALGSTKVIIGYYINQFTNASKNFPRSREESSLERRSR